MGVRDSENESSRASHGDASAVHSGHPRVIALTGGKGGVGKTSVAVNLALTLARRGQRVLLLDADTDLANVSILLGLYPTRTLEHAMTGECPLSEVIQEGPHGLHIIAGASGVERCMDLDVGDARSVLAELASMERAYDLVLVDTASGLRPAALHMIAAASLACLVITPDPASLTDAFSLLRVLQRRGYRRTPGVVVNMAAGASQAQAVYRRFAGATRRHLDMDAQYIGAIWRDESIRQSVELQRPVALLAESDPSSRQFVSLSGQLLTHLARLPERPAGLGAYWSQRSRRLQAPPATAATSGAPAPQVPGDDAAAVQASPKARCSALFAELERLLAAQPADAALRQEALRGASALLSQIAAAPERLSPQDPPGYSQEAFGSQQALLARLKSQPDSVSVEGFLASQSGTLET